MKIGYLGSPGPYGHFTLYRNIRTGLAAHGLAIRWIGHGRWAADTMRDPAWQCESPFGEVVAGDTVDQDTIGKTVVRHILDQEYDVIVNNFPQDRSLMNVARYLPETVRRVVVVGMMGSGTYRLCRAVRDSIHATVALARACATICWNSTDSIQTGRLFAGRSISPRSKPCLSVRLQHL